MSGACDAQNVLFWAASPIGAAGPPLASTRRFRHQTTAGLASETTRQTLAVAALAFPENLIHDFGTCRDDRAQLPAVYDFSCPGGGVPG